MAKYTVIAAYSQYVETTIEANNYDEALELADEAMYDGTFEGAACVDEGPFELVSIHCPDGETVYF